MPPKAELLNDLTDEELQTTIARANELLAERDKKRKDEALERARSILEGAGLSLKDVGRNGHKKATAVVHYQMGHQYQHPTNKVLTWSGRGKKPNWLRELEAQNAKAMELT
jgi:DNA-binding protein H-NS